MQKTDKEKSINAQLGIPRKLGGKLKKYYRRNLIKQRTQLLSCLY